LDLLLHLSLITRTRGELAGLDYVKSLRDSFMGYLSGNPVRGALVGVTKDGLPKVLVPFMQGYSRTEVPVGILQLLTTILYCTRALSLGRFPDTSTLTDPSLKGALQIDEHVGAF